MLIPSRPKSAEVARLQAIQNQPTSSDPLRLTAENVNQSIQPLPPPSTSLVSSPSGIHNLQTRTLRPVLRVHNRVKVKATDDDEDASTVTKSTSFAISSSDSRVSSLFPRGGGGGGGSNLHAALSLRSLLAVKRAATTLKSGTRDGANREASSFQPLPFQPLHSQFLQSRRQGVSSSPLQFLLDVGSLEVESTETMVALANVLKSHCDGLAKHLEEYTERVEMHLALDENNSRTPAAAAASAARELIAFIPKQLPEIVLCYWDFTISDTMESLLGSAFAKLGEAIVAARDLLTGLHNHEEENKKTSSSDVDKDTHHHPPLLLPSRCKLFIKLFHCKLRGMSFTALPLMFSTVSRSETVWESAFQLESLSVCHSSWRESARSGLQAVLRVSGWSIRSLELRGGMITTDLLRAITLMAQQPNSRLQQLTFANCGGWSSLPDAEPQMYLLHGLRDAVTPLDCLSLQGVPLPPKAGIALLELAGALPPCLRDVRLESCHMVTPKFLTRLRETIARQLVTSTAKVNGGPPPPILSRSPQAACQ